MQRLNGALEELHGAIQKLTQNDVRGKIAKEIHSLLKVQEAYEEQMTSLITGTMLTRFEEGEIAAETERRREVRVAQSEQTRKLFKEIHAHEVSITVFLRLVRDAYSFDPNPGEGRYRFKR